MKKLIFPVLGVLSALAGCSPSERLEAPEQLCIEIFDAFNAHDWEAMATYYADSLEHESPDGRFGTKAELLAHYRNLHGVFPDIHDEIKNIYPSGSSVIIEFVAKGTAADGSKLELPILGILTFKNGKVVRDVTYYDM